MQRITTTQYRFMRFANRSFLVLAVRGCGTAKSASANRKGKSTAAPGV
jgi:hypothetical protein